MINIRHQEIKRAHKCLKCGYLINKSDLSEEELTAIYRKYEGYNFTKPLDKILMGWCNYYSEIVTSKTVGCMR